MGIVVPREVVWFTITVEVVGDLVVLCWSKVETGNVVGGYVIVILTLGANVPVELSTTIGIVDPRRAEVD